MCDSIDGKRPEQASPQRQESEFLVVSVWGGDGSGVEGVAADMGGASCSSE